MTTRLKQPILMHITHDQVVNTTTAHQTFINTLSSMDSFLDTNVEEEYKEGKLRIFWLQKDGSEQDIWPQQDSYLSFLQRAPKLELFVVLRELKSFSIADYYGNYNADYHDEYDSDSSSDCY